MMLARARVGVVARHYLVDLQLYTAICAAVLALAGIASVASAPMMLGRSGAANAAARLPGPVAKLLGLAVGRSLDTGVGHLNATFLSVVLPIALIALGIVGAAKAIAGAAATGELEMLASQPVTRTQIVGERLIAIVLAQIQAALPATIIVAVGSHLGDIGVGGLTVLGGAARSIVLAALITAAVMMVSSVTSKPAVPAAIGAALTLVVFLVSASGASSISPARLALTSAPAAGGGWLGTAAVAFASIWITVIAGVAFERRDIC
ncbi:MAG: hypothetical protein GY708_03740 [Actinomycetia bacterium]|nr:hypothetical protein [Actinomycetes bacterium]MCP4960264.1 hypothetical protein [Actinomycetes bacterium]